MFSLLLMIAPLGVHAMSADSSSCAHSYTGAQSQGGDPGVQAQDTVSAVFILSRFEDELPTGYSDTGCSADPWPPVGPQWPADQLPTWADDFLEDTTEPQNVQSLTYLLDLMSSGQHLLKGRTYSKVVTLPAGSSFSSWGEVNKAVIESCDIHLDFSDFDEEPDGTVDFVFIYHRQQFTDPPNTFSGALSTFSDLGLAADVPVDGGVRKVVNARGCNIATRAIERGFFVTRGYSAHEYMHDLADNFMAWNHIRTIGVYGIMDGTNRAFHDGFGIVSTYLRLGLGWLDASTRTIDTTELPIGTSKTYELQDVGLNGELGFLKIETHIPEQHFLVEFRDSTSMIYKRGDELYGCDNESDPLGSGLVISHVSEELRPRKPCPPAEADVVSGWWITPALSNDQFEPVCETNLECCENQPLPDCIGDENYPPTIDIEVATGMFHEETWAPDPIRGWDAQSWFENFTFGWRSDDLFKPGPQGVSCFTPFTNPSTNLYFVPTSGSYRDLVNCPYRQDQTIYSGLSFYNVEWTGTEPGGGNGRIRVTIRRDDPATPPPLGAPHVIPDGMVWDGLVQLVSDVEIPDGSTLTVKEDARIVAAAMQDLQQAGRDAAGVEIGAQGAIVANGSPSSPVIAMTSRDANFVHFTFDTTGTPPGLDLGSGENGETSGTADWYGIRFKSMSEILAEVGCGYGFASARTSSSVLENVEIRDATRGIALESAGAPVLVDPTMVQSEIYIDSVDFYVPLVLEGPQCDKRGWTFTNPVTVMAANGTKPGADISGGNPGKVDGFAHGTVATSSAGGGSTWRPEFFVEDSPPNECTGDEWGGIYFDWRSAGSALQGDDVGHAINPIFMAWPDGTVIDGCTVHNFRDFGIWAADAVYDGALITNNTIYRGSALRPQDGEIGILINRCPNTLVSGNAIQMTGQDASSPPGSAIRIDNGLHYCLQSGSEPDTLVIDGNVLVGPNNTNLAPQWSGLHLNWACGISARDILLKDNVLDDWRGPGGVAIRMDQCVDVQLTCNEINSSHVGISFSRNTEPTGPGARFRENRIVGASDDPAGRAIVTDNGDKVKLGPNSMTKGHNEIEFVTDLAYLVERKTEAGTPDTLDARYNKWITPAGTITDDEEVWDYCRGPSGEGPTDPLVAMIWPDSVRSSLARCGLGGLRIISSLHEEVVSEPHEASPPIRRLPSSTPRVTSLDVPYPIPFRDRVNLEFGIAGTDPTSITIDIFDVTGRRVYSIARSALIPGRYRATWDGKRDDGLHVSAGVYFVRFQAGGVSPTTQKLVAVH